MWLAWFIGAYPLVVFRWLVAPVLEDVSLLLRAALVPLVLMTYLVMPLVTRLLHGRLCPRGEHGG